MLRKLEKKRGTTAAPKVPIEGTIKDLGKNDFGMQELIYSLGEQSEKSKPEQKPEQTPEQKPEQTPEQNPESKRNKRNKQKKNKLGLLTPEPADS